MTDLSILEQCLLTCDAPESVWRPALEGMTSQIDGLKTAGRNARDDATAALVLVSRIRMALNDNGKRMQDELLDYCRDLAQMPYRIQKLREGILEARREGCACDFHLYGEDQELDSDAALDAYCTMEQALNKAEIRTAELEHDRNNLLSMLVECRELIGNRYPDEAAMQLRIDHVLNLQPKG